MVNSMLANLSFAAGMLCLFRLKFFSYSAIFTCFAYKVGVE